MYHNYLVTTLVVSSFSVYIHTHMLYLIYLLNKLFILYA